MNIRFSFALLALIGLTTISSAFAPAPVYREPPPAKVPDVYTAMQGTWEINNVNNVRMLGGARGAVMARRVVMQQKIRIQGTSWCYIFDNNGTEIESTKYEIALDPKAAPATLDLKQPGQNVQFGGLAPAGGFGGAALAEQIAMKGIVKVEGDTLTFCYVSGYQQNAERPKQFFAGNQMMPNGIVGQSMTLKRVK